MKTNTTTAAKLMEVSRQLGLSLPEVMLRRERELNETPPEVAYEKLQVAIFEHPDIVAARRITPREEADR